MEFEVLPRQTAHERARHKFRYILNERDIALLESLPAPTSVDDEDWYEAAADACLKAKLGWHGPSVLRWVTKKLAHETDA